MSSNVINTNNLCYSIGSVNIINNLNLSVKENVICGFLGHNGAGKSTTLKLLLNLLPATRGEIFLFGKEMPKSRIEILSSTGSLIEAPSLYAHLTVEENMGYLERIFYKKRKQTRELLELVGLWKDRSAKASHLSTGMKQRLGIAMSLFNDPQLIILDEPLNGLDPASVYEMRELLKHLKKVGKTIFLSSHLLREVEKICSDIVIIDKGSMLYQGSMDKLCSSSTTYLKISSDNNLLALKVLSENTLITSQLSQDIIQIKTKSEDELGRLFYLLSENRIAIKSITTENEDLEEIFLKLTQNTNDSI